MRNFLKTTFAAAGFLLVSGLAYADLQGQWQTRTPALLEQSWGNHQQFDCDLTVTLDLREDVISYMKDLACCGDAPSRTETRLSRLGDDLYYKGAKVGYVSNTELKFEIYDESIPNFPVGEILDISLRDDQRLFLDDMNQFGLSGNYKRLRGTLFKSER